MKVARLRLVVATVLLVAWLGWLAYLVLAKTNPVVVSRSQAMASTDFVLAELTVDPTTGLPGRQVRVVEDLRPQKEPLTGKIIDVWNLKETRIAGKEGGFEERMTYLLMLTRSAEGTFDVTAAPRAPGHDNPLRPRPWVYRWADPGVQSQFAALVPGR